MTAAHRDLPTMKTLLSFCALLALSVSHAAWGAQCSEEYDYSPFSIKLPANFKEIAPRVTGNTATFVYREDKPETEIAAVLQIMFHVLAPDPKDLQGDAEGLKLVHLDRFLKSIERRRVDFQKSDIGERKFGNADYKRIAWKGKAYGAEMAGVMYATLAKATVVTISIQDGAVGAAQSLPTLEACMETLNVTGE
jgi:hypothetical protein